MLVRSFRRVLPANATTRSTTLRPAMLAAAFVACSGTGAIADVIRFDNFSDTRVLSLNRDARVVGTGSNAVLRLANATTFSSGSTFSNVTVNARDFYTKFSFRISSAGGIPDPWDGVPGADGLAFVVQSVSSSIGGSGGGLGYQGIPNSVAVGFDTFQNTQFGDPDGNHIEIDSNGSVNSLQTAGIVPRLDSGTVYFAWIEYDGTRLSAWFNNIDIRPSSPIIARNINIAQIIGNNLGYVGFTGATGNAWGDHDILTWEYQPFIPSPSATALLGLGGLLATRRRR